MADHFQAYRLTPATISPGLNAPIFHSAVDYNQGFAQNTPSGEIIPPPGVHRATLHLTVTNPDPGLADLKGSIWFKLDGVLTRSFPWFIPAVPTDVEASFSFSFLQRFNGERMQVFIGNTGSGPMKVTSTFIAMESI